MASPTEKDLEQFRQWKDKQSYPDFELDRQKELRDFREKYGVEKASPFTCPFCTGWGGRLYLNEERGIYICRTCELQIYMEFINPEKLKELLDERKARRAEKRLAKKGQAGVKPGHEDIPPEVLAHLRSIQGEAPGDEYLHGIMEKDSDEDEED